MRSLLLVLVLAACGGKAPATAAPTNTGGKADGIPLAPPSPHASKEWIDKLGDPKESERAVTELEHLGDPAAIQPLGKLWLADGRPVRVLQVMISLARPLTPDEAKARFVTDYETGGRPASWSQAEPYLTAAVDDVDEANPRSVDSAVKAAEALGEAKLGVGSLAGLATRIPTKKLISAQIAAIRALGAFAGVPEASAALVKLVGRAPPAHPRLAADKAQAREMEVTYSLYLAVTGASVNALGELNPKAAATPLVLVMYRTPELMMQVRRALVAVGPEAKAQLRLALRGEHAEVNELFRANKLDKYCGDRGDAQQCELVSARSFYASVVLGDFYDPATVPDLLAVLKETAAPPYFMDDAPAPTTQYNAAFDALRKIGAPAAAPQVRAAWQAKKADVAVRALAASTYAFVARDQTGVAELGAIAADNNADDALRQEAALAFARLSTSTNDLKPLDVLAQKYLDAAAKQRKEAGAQQKTVAAADKTFEAAKLAMETAKTELLAIMRNSSSTPDQIRAKTAAVKKLEDAYKKAKAKHKEQTAPFKQADTTAKAYVSFARMFQTHMARIETAARCKQDLACYAATLNRTEAEVVAALTPYIKDLPAWSKDERHDLVAASIDRAMLELGKAGPAASAHTGALLDAAVSDDRVVRQSVLLALPKLAKLPCGECVTKLDAAIKAGEGKTTLGDLNLETQMLRNYFAWAGR